MFDSVTWVDEVNLGDDQETTVFPSFSSCFRILSEPYGGMLNEGFYVRPVFANPEGLL